MSIARARGTLIAILMLSCAAAHSADPQAGKALSQAQCSQCHDADDWVGESAASLESLIRYIVAGKVKHKTAVRLSDAQIADVAAYWAQASAKQR